MFEGVGIQTILGTFATITVGVMTPADCYVGVGGKSPSSTFDIASPMGTLGCQYDIDNVRIFAEHISSPAKSNDFPGINHAGLKALMRMGEFTGYAGVSAAIPSQQLDDAAILSMVGAETSGPVRLYGEWIMSVDNPQGGMLTGGIKLLF